VKKRSQTAQPVRVAIGYIRVSTTRQADGGFSLDDQRAAIERWCKANDYKLTDIFEDAGLSGMKKDRPGLDAALAACTKGAALVVYSLSRLGRSNSHLLQLSEDLERAGVDLVSLSEKIDTTTAAGRAFYGMSAVFAQFTRDVISEQIRDNLQQKIANGERAGEIPYGKQLKLEKVLDPRNGKTRTLKRLVVSEREQGIIERVRRLKTRGLSLRGIASRLTSGGFKPRGRKWYAQTVKNILRPGNWRKTRYGRANHA